MKKKIEYRVFKRQDKKELIRILTDQVYSSFFEKGKDAERYSRFILNKNLGTCKYRKVAVAGDKIVGVILGIKKDKNRLLSSLKQKISEMPLKIKKKNKEALKCLLLLDQMEQELLNQNNVDNEKLIVLLLVEKRYERTEIQEILLKDWENEVAGTQNGSTWIVVNSRTEPEFLNRNCFQKLDEKFSMIQPKEQRFRFYKMLYIRNA